MNDPFHAASTPHHGSFKAYVVGFALSIILTLLAYFLVVEQILATSVLIFTIVGLAFLQAIIQLLFFLRLGLEGKPHWNLFTFLFMALVGVVIVLGSLWIIYDLDNRVMPTMPPMDVHTYLHYQE